MISKELRTEIVRTSLLMDQKGWVANHDGNITVRLGDATLAATPTARAKRDLDHESIIEVDMQGKKLGGGPGGVFSEIALHLAVFQARSDVRAVVHAHCPHAMAVGCANQEMVTTAVPEAVVSLGAGVPLVGLGLPGSIQVMEEFTAILPYYDAVMIAGNGVFAWGKNLEQAFLRLELVEHLAKVLLFSLPLGGPKLLSPEQVRVLLKRREDAGLSLPADPSHLSWSSA